MPLQVLNAYGEWQAVGPLGLNQVLVMPGYALEHALCGLLSAAQHRVASRALGYAVLLAMIDFQSPPGQLVSACQPSSCIAC